MANAQTELEAANKKNSAKSKLAERLAKKKTGGLSGNLVYIFIYSLLINYNLLIFLNSWW